MQYMQLRILQDVLKFTQVKVHCIYFKAWDSSAQITLYTNEVAHQARAYPGFCRIKLLDGILLHHRVTSNIKVASTHGWRETQRVKCLAQEHNTVSPARARTQAAESRVKRTSHEATASPGSRLFQEHVLDQKETTLPRFSVRTGDQQKSLSKFDDMNSIVSS